MNTYGAKHSQLYNLIYADKPYAQEARFVEDCLRRFAQGSAIHLLELACGTGNHSFELEAFGHKILATDISVHMLETAARRKRELGSCIELRQMDMTEITVSPGSCDAVISLFDSIGYVGTNEAIDRVMGGVAKALRVGGLFVFEFWHAAAMLRSFEPVRVRRWSTPDGEVLRISETAIDHMENTAQVQYTIFEPSGDGAFCCHQESQKNRYFLVPQMAMHLAHAGLTPLAWYAGFDDKKIVDAETWHVVAVARKTRED